jgi:hypothetical protein
VPKILRRKKYLGVLKDGITSIYCRKCTKDKPPKDFYVAVDKFLDVNGYMSICRNCASDMYVMFYNSQHSLDRAIYKTCKAINILYSASAVNSTMLHISTQQKLDDDPSVFGIYKSKLVSSQKGTNIGKMDDATVGMDLTFRETSIPEYSEEERDFDGSESVVDFWGDGYDAEQYRFLEREIADWKKSYSCQNKAEEFFLKQICLKSLELEIANKENGKGADSILKSMQELLKNAALTPAQQNAANSGKGNETWGIFIKNIEETTPAEYYKDKTLFKDIDRIDDYIKKYITRPLKNFVTGSRDFNIIEDDTTEYDDIPLEVKNDTEEGKTEQTLSG